jgi:hypothetical protein
MADTQSEKTSLARLTLFMICLAVAGSIGAGLHYYAVDLPQQKVLQAPANQDNCIGEWMNCRHGCDEGCRGPCLPEEQEGFNRCFDQCDAYYHCFG